MYASMRQSMSVSLSARQVWGMPITLALVSAVGLASALLGDGIWDVVSWISLGAPIAIIVWHLLPGGPQTGGYRKGTETFLR